MTCGLPSDRPADLLRQRLRAALRQAIGRRDWVAMAALRSALAAIDNAEAPDATLARMPIAGHATLAGTVAGLGAAEVERRTLSTAQVEQLIQAEINDREAAAQEYHRAGRSDMAERLRAENEVLRSCFEQRDPA
jgi:uncharacterized protein YqeY